MTYYAKAKGSIPFHIREEERRWQEHLRKHKQMVKRSKPTIRNLDKTVEHRHLQIKLKRLQIHEDRLATIDYENRKLLEKINRVERRSDKQTWNENYKYMTPRTSRSITNGQTSNRESSFDEESIYLSTDDDNDDDDEVDGSEHDEQTSDARPETSSDVMETVREREREEIEEEKRKIKEKMEENKPRYKRENTIEYLHRVGLNATGNAKDGDESTRENDRLHKRLVHMLKLDPNTKLEGETADRRYERQRMIEEAREAVSGENGSPRKRQNYRNYDERILENMRLNRKVVEIKKGIGKPNMEDPSYNSHDRWWVTSPRGRDKDAYESEKRRLIEETKKRKLERKKERARQEKMILKKQEEEELKKKTSAPDGYRKRKKKKSKPKENKKEELPDVSIIQHDLYQNSSIVDSEDENDV